MKPTLPPFWSSFQWQPSPEELSHRNRYNRRRLTIGMQEYRPRQNAPDMSIYADFIPKQIRHLIRLDGGMGFGQALIMPTLPAAWLQARNSRDPPRLWQMPDFSHIELVHLEKTKTTVKPFIESEPSNDVFVTEVAIIAIIIFIFIVAMLILTIIKDNFFCANRRRSDEWHTPSVNATRHQISNSSCMDSNIDFASLTTPDGIATTNYNNDLPPPYYECAVNNSNKYNDISLEEPPPPYSDCYVTFSNPKDGLPAVHFYNNQRQIMFSGERNIQETVLSTDANVIDNATVSLNIRGCEDGVRANGSSLTIERNNGIHCTVDSNNTIDHIVLKNLSSDSSTIV